MVVAIIAAVVAILGAPAPVPADFSHAVLATCQPVLVASVDEVVIGCEEADSTTDEPRYAVLVVSLRDGGVRADVGP